MNESFTHPASSNGILHSLTELLPLLKYQQLKTKFLLLKVFFFFTQTEVHSAYWMKWILVQKVREYTLFMAHVRQDDKSRALSRTSRAHRIYSGPVNGMGVNFSCHDYMASWFSKLPLFAIAWILVKGRVHWKWDFQKHLGLTKGLLPLPSLRMDSSQPAWFLKNLTP